MHAAAQRARGPSLVFSGEEFPEPGTRRHFGSGDMKLPRRARPTWCTGMRRNTDFPKGLNGRFHGLAADRLRGTAMLFNDRFGLQRLYYHEANDAFYFSAEAKAILKVRPELRTPIPAALENSSFAAVFWRTGLSFGVSMSFHRARLGVFRDGALEGKAAYFEPTEWEEQERLEPEHITCSRDTFVRRLPRYFNGQERVGVSLTGGLDTRIIMAWRKPAPGSLPCYTFGSMYRDNQDVILARKVAEICGQSHEVITTGKEFLSAFRITQSDRSISRMPAVDLSRSPDLYVNEKPAR